MGKVGMFQIQEFIRVTLRKASSMVKVFSHMLIIENLLVTGKME